MAYIISEIYKEPTQWCIDVDIDGMKQQLSFNESPTQEQILSMIESLIYSKEKESKNKNIGTTGWLNTEYVPLVKQGENMAWNNRTETTTVVTFLKKILIDRKNAEVTLTYAKAFPTGALNELGQPTYEDFVEQSFTLKITDLVANYGISAESIMSLDTTMDDMAQAVYGQLTNVSV
jgi:hypothetical protein